MLVKQILCKSALVKSALPGLTYTLNPYYGCAHKCLYCYSPAVLKEWKREWGEFVDVKINIVDVLSKELKRGLKKGTVGISTVTDPYQWLERQYKLTRSCLEALLKSDFPISIQTKSSLVCRDLDLISEFGDADVGFTITTFNDALRKKYELRSSTISERLRALKKIADAGIKTWVFIGPILPAITDKLEELDILFEHLADANVERIIFDRLRIKPGLWQRIEKFVILNLPDKIKLYRKIFSTSSETKKYYDPVRRRIKMLANKYGMVCESAF